MTICIFFMFFLCRAPRVHLPPQVSGAPNAPDVQKREEAQSRFHSAAGHRPQLGPLAPSSPFSLPVQPFPHCLQRRLFLDSTLVPTLPPAHCTLDNSTRVSVPLFYRALPASKVCPVDHCCVLIDRHQQPDLTEKPLSQTSGGGQ